MQPHTCSVRAQAALGGVLTAATMPESAGVAMGAIIVEMGCRIREPAEVYISLSGAASLYVSERLSAFASFAARNTAAHFL